MAEIFKQIVVRENVFGHAKKLELIQRSLTALRKRRGRALRILDVGCGNGVFVTQHLGTNGDQVVGVDLHADSIAFAQENLSRPGLEFLCMAAEDLAGRQDKFDAIVFADVLEHVDDPLALLNYANSLLQPDGCVLISIPNGFGPFELESFVSRIPLLGSLLLWLSKAMAFGLYRILFPWVWKQRVAMELALPYNHSSGHVHFYTQGSFLNITAKAGLQLVQSRNLSWLSGPFTNYFFGPFENFCSWNCKVADHLPAPLVTGWYFEFGLINASGQTP